MGMIAPTGNRLFEGDKEKGLRAPSTCPLRRRSTGGCERCSWKRSYTSVAAYEGCGAIATVPQDTIQCQQVFPTH